MMALSLLAAIMTPMASAASVSATKKGAALQFHQDGKFKIMMISDTQDTDKADQRMLNFINASLDQERPDHSQETTSQANGLDPRSRKFALQSIRSFSRWWRGAFRLLLSSAIMMGNPR